MIKLIISFIVIYIAITYIKNLISFLKKDKKKQDEPGDEMVEVACCGTFVLKSETLEKKSGGKRLYFCNKECWNEYKKEK